MQNLLAEGFMADSVEDRINYGLKLARELHSFTDTFLPHMREEEEVIVLFIRLLVVVSNAEVMNVVTSSL